MNAIKRKIFLTTLTFLREVLIGKDFESLAEFKKLFIRWDCDFARDFIVTSLLPVDPKLEDQLEETSLWTQDAK